MLLLQNVRYAHPDGDVRFQDLSLRVASGEKLALVGANGTGKSTLLQLLSGRLQPTSGTVQAEPAPYYIPQHFGQYDGWTVAQALGVHERLTALRAILAGSVAPDDFTRLNDDWTVEERCADALAAWGLTGAGLDAPLAAFSGGEKTKIFLAGIAVHRPATVLLDEPSNHLDAGSRDVLYHYVRTTTDTLVVVSHDRALLHLLPAVVELDARGLTRYGGDYTFYTAQKAAEAAAFEHTLADREKALRKAKEVAREVAERQQKRDARGKRQQVQAGLPTISMNTFRNRAENSTARTGDVHAEKTAALAGEVSRLRDAAPRTDAMKLGLDASALHRGKLLVDAQQVNQRVGDRWLWKAPLTMQLRSGERVSIGGRNGSGKTTLLRLLTGLAAPDAGTVVRAAFRFVYADQDYALIRNDLTVHEQAQAFNTGGLHDPEVRSRLTHFLFTPAQWDKPCDTLSGGERMRLLLCCLTLAPQAPDLIVLDEPTNNLDVQSADILTAALRDYAGTVVVVSHDAHFLSEMRLERTVLL